MTESDNPVFTSRAAQDLWVSYLLSFSMFIIAVLKLVFPEHIGLYIKENIS